MWIRNFDLDDFGCFQRARFRDLEDGLTIIAGPQRAGKTTFMKALRQLGYGISNGADLPPPTDEYRLAADLVHDGADLQLSLTGHSSPKLITNGTDAGLEDLYGVLTADQYRQLFTISLDQLRRKPKGIEDRKELSAVLLGAGYVDIAQIPEIKNDFFKDAKKIAGKNGQASYQIKAPLERIEEGIAGREAAKAHVDEHRETQRELDTVNDEIEAIDSQLAELELETARLATVDANFQAFMEYRELSSELEGVDLDRIKSFPIDRLAEAKDLQRRYADVRSDRDSKRREFERTTEYADIDERKAALLDRDSHIEHYNEQISGWEATAVNLRDRADDLRAKRGEMQRRAASLKEAWKDDLEAVLSVPLDAISRDRVERITRTYNDASNRIEEAERELRQDRAALEEAEENLDEAKEEAKQDDWASHVVKRFAVLASLGVLVGLGIGLLVDPIGGVIAMAAIVAIGVGWLYVQLRGGAGGPGESPVRELRMQKSSLEADIQSHKRRLEDAQAKKADAEDDLEELRSTLTLPESVSADGLRSFYDDLDRLQDDIEAVQADEDALERERDDFEETLRTAKAELVSVLDIEWDADHPIDYLNALITGIRTAKAELASAEALDESEAEVDAVKSDITVLLVESDEFDRANADEASEDDLQEVFDSFIEEGEELAELDEQSDRRSDLVTRLEAPFDRRAVREAFEPLRAGSTDATVEPATDDVGGNGGDVWYLDALARVVDQYVDHDAVQARIEAIDEAEARLNDERKELVSDRIALEGELDDLASDEDIVAAQEAIERGRQELRPLAEEYATLRIGEYLMDALHDRFIEEATGPLLEDASEIFGHITDEYDEVDHTGSLDNLDFKALREDGEIQGTGELSRATAEQLFLAVRIARIQQLDVSLPVVLDDSLTNFDPRHLSRTLELVEELAKTNQVFFLTCHPQFVKTASKRASVSQYWSLDRGQFEGPHTAIEEVTSVLV